MTSSNHFEPANTVPTDTEVVNAITGAVQVAGMNMNALRAYSPPRAMTFCTGVPTGCNTTSKIQICRGVQLNNTAPPQQCGIVVSYAYAVPLSFSMNNHISPLLNIPPVTVSTSVQVAQEQ